MRLLNLRKIKHYCVIYVLIHKLIKSRLSNQMKSRNATSMAVN